MKNRHVGKTQAPPSRDHFVALFFARQYTEALRLTQALLKLNPRNTQAWFDAGTCNIYLERWTDAWAAFNKALLLGYKNYDLFDGLCHAALKLGKHADAQRFGTLALKRRDESIPELADTLMPTQPRPAFNASKPEHNAIAFSLYGASSHYCETAILNAQRCAAIYPGWHCRFYMDSTVPSYIRERLLAQGAQLIDALQLDAQAATLPGTMWRFLAADETTLDFVLFRDADSLISSREAGAVAAWLASERWFHAMRDSGTQTELLLAGMWGLARGALPPLQPLMHQFCAAGHHPTHADQLFLRTQVWPYVRKSVCQHDSLFSFMDAQAFPDGPTPSDKYASIGYDNAAGQFHGNVPLPDGSEFTWALFDIRSTPNIAICRYRARCAAGRFTANLPRDYIDALKSGEFVMKLIPETVANTPIS